MKNARLWIFAAALSAFIFGCDNGSQVMAPNSSASFTKDKASKKCASCGFVTYLDERGFVYLLDQTTSPIDTIATLEIQYVSDLARSGDALYVMENDAHFYVFDLSDPKNP